MADLQSSFIPKQVLTREARPRSEPLGLLFVLSLVVLLIALLFYGGVFVYKNNLTKQIAELNASIEKSRESIERERILTIDKLDKQLKRAATILNNHKTFLSTFKILEDQTLKSIRYTGLTQAGASLTLRGLARDYEGVARQSIVFGAAYPTIQDFVFSDLSADATGRVSFSLKLDLDPKLLSYSDFINPALPWKLFYPS